MTRPHPDLPERTPLAEHHPGTRDDLLAAAHIGRFTEKA